MADLSPAPFILTDEQTRRLYANDASMYEELPRGVCFPKNLQEIRQLVRRANAESFSITPRGAGTSLAGQTTGNGVVMDVSRHMSGIPEINAEQKFAYVEPGVIRDTLNREAGKYRLLFGPDTATTDRCMLGGMIGNNSCGSFSIKYGTTREHVLEIEAVLSDGSIVRFKPLTPQELEQKKQLHNLEGHIYRGMLQLIERNRKRILDAYPHPDIIRRNTGYALDRLCTMQPFDPNGRLFNMAELLCGSEGTLAMTASAKIRLVAADPHAVLVVPHFRTLRESMKAAVEAVRFNPAAVELVDHIILDATKDNIEQRKNRFFLEGEPDNILIIQFDGNSRDGIREKAGALVRLLQEKDLGYAHPIIEDQNNMRRVWELRKAGLGLLMGLGADSRSPTFCEDTCVRVEDLPEYIEEFRQLLDKYRTECVFYAHASVGELHLRPVIDLQKPGGVEKMKSMAGEIAGLVKKYRGSLSGEHGDGRARAPHIEKVLGKEMMPLLRKVKELWDPNCIFNPGKILDPKPIDADLRFSPLQYKKPEVKTVFKWRKEEGFGGAVELCNGAGVCRKLPESGGTMCPSYHATREEKDTTRGRANLFRQLFSTRQAEAFTSEELKDALDLCLSCKACKSECPANVDMARMKAEFMNGWHRENGIKFSERFFAGAGKIYPLVSQMPGLSNWMLERPAVKELLYRLFNIHPHRTLPKFAREPFDRWFQRKRSKIRPTANPESFRDGRKGKVALFVDLFTNYHDPDIARAALEVLQKLGYEVVIPPVHESGRPQLSKGMLDDAKTLAGQLIPVFYGYASQGIPIVGLEPSEILTFRDEYLDLCEDDQLEQAGLVAEHSFQFEEFVLDALSDSGLSVDASDQPQKVYVHGHCHAKALVGMEPVMELLNRIGYDAEDLATGCCGMAGSFGYEADKYQVSMEIGEQLLFPKLRRLKSDALICTPGFSCRHQIMDGAGRKTLHPAELLAQRLV